MMKEKARSSEGEHCIVTGDISGPEERKKMHRTVEGSDRPIVTYSKENCGDEMNDQAESETD